MEIKCLVLTPQNSKDVRINIQLLLFLFLV